MKVLGDGVEIIDNIFCNGGWWWGMRLKSGFKKIWGKKIAATSMMWKLRAHEIIIPVAAFLKEAPCPPLPICHVKSQFVLYLVMPVFWWWWWWHLGDFLLQNVNLNKRKLQTLNDDDVGAWGENILSLGILLERRTNRNAFPRLVPVYTACSFSLGNS